MITKQLLLVLVAVFPFLETMCTMPHSQLPGAALGADGLPAGNEGADINNPLFPGYFQVSYPMAPEFYDGITIPESSVPYYEWPQVYDYYNYPVTFLAPEYRKYPLTPDQYEDLYWVNMYSPFKDSSGNSILSNDEYGYPVRIPGTTEDIPTPVEFRDLFNQWQNYCFDAPTWSPQINNVNYNY